MRDDLPISVKRELAWGRRAFVRDVGRLYCELIEAGQDPSTWVEETKEKAKELRDEGKHAA